MNKEYAMEILSHVETKALECDSSLAREAFRYLRNLKSVQNDEDLYARIITAQNGRSYNFSAGGRQ